MGCEALECHSLARARDTSVGAESVHRGLLLATPRLFFPRLLRTKCLSLRINLLLHAQPWQHLMIGDPILSCGRGTAGTVVTSSGGSSSGKVMEQSRVGLHLLLPDVALHNLVEPNLHFFLRAVLDLVLHSPHALESQSDLWWEQSSEDEQRLRRLWVADNYVLW
jgi:hypothetical protein